MKYFLIGIVLSLIVGFGLQLLKAWFLEIRFQCKKRHAKGRDKWTYEI